MQEELEQKSVAISIKAGKLTANLLKKAVEKALAEMEKSQKNPKIYKGKQSVKPLFGRVQAFPTLRLQTATSNPLSALPASMALISR